MVFGLPPDPLTHTSQRGTCTSWAQPGATTFPSGRPVRRQTWRQARCPPPMQTPCAASSRRCQHRHAGDGSRTFFPALCQPCPPPSASRGTFSATRSRKAQLAEDHPTRQRHAGRTFLRSGGRSNSGTTPATTDNFADRGLQHGAPRFPGLAKAQS